jgi:hypothetical protein
MVIGPILVGVLAIVAVVVYLIANNGSPKQTPAPTSSQAAVVVPTQPATSPGTSEPMSTGVPPTTNSSLQPTPVGSPSTANEALLLQIPLEIRPSCGQGTILGPSIVASIMCNQTTDGITVSYLQYDSVDDMNAAYQAAFKAVEIDANSGSCEDVETWPAESSYDVGGTLAGRRLCLDEGTGNYPTIIWTYDSLAILSTADTTGDPAALIDFWTNEAGPIP